MKSENRNPKSEISLPREIRRIRQRPLPPAFGFGLSTLLRTSDFGLRISALAAASFLLLSLAPSASAAPGLSADYYDNADFTTLKFTRTDAVVNFDWGTAAPTNTMGADTFSVRWYGQLEPRYSETYTFHVEADDGARLWVNDQLIAARTVYSAAVPEITGTAALHAGERVNLRLEFIENAGNSRVKLSWSSPSQVEEVIPASVLYPALVDPERGGLLAEFWAGLAGTNLTTLTTNANFPSHPTGREFLTSFECFQTNVADSFGTRVTGWVIPPTNGAYVFAVAAADTAQLFLSTNSAAANKLLRASVPVATGFRQFTLFSAQTSAPVVLTAGAKCYIELLQKADTNADHFSVAWRPPGATNFTVIPAESLVSGGLDRTAPAQSAYLDTLATGHPRLFATAQRFEWLRRTLASNSVPQLNSWWTAISNSAFGILAQPVNVYSQDDRDTILGISRSVLDRTYKLAFVYRLTGNTNFAERAWLELQQVASTNFPDWDPSHFLDTAEMTHASAIGYDWLHDYWTPARLDTIRVAIQVKGLKPSLTLYTNSSSWVGSGANNWNLVCNGGMILGALALGTEGESTNEFVLSKAVASAAAVMRHYTTDNGGWYEGPGYWDYTTDYNIRLMAGLESALGSDLGLSDTRNLAETGVFAMGMVGPFKKSFNFADAGAGGMGGSQLFWLGRRFLRPEFAAQERSIAGGTDALDSLWYDPRGTNAPASGMAPDYYFRGPTGTTPYFTADAVTLRTRWLDSDATFIGFKAGEVGASHGHLDAGSFVLDALGVRWAHDLGGDDYALPGYFSEPQRWTYYRLRAEGHNTLVINSGTNADQIVDAKPPIISFASAPEGDNSFAVADLTSAYGITRVWRGVQLFNNRRWTLVQDELQAAAPASGWWFMHFSSSATSAQIETNGTAVMLTQGSDRLWVKILSGPGTFAISNAVPLATSPNPAGQDTNGTYKKLAIRLTGITNTTLAVLMVPLIPGQPTPTNLPAVVPLLNWSNAAASSSVIPTNTPPGTTGTTATTSIGAFVDVDLQSLAQDSETATSNLLFAVSNPVSGSVALLADGHTARFTPTAGFAGLASFKYTVNDTWPDSRMMVHYDLEPPENPATGFLTDRTSHSFYGALTTVGTGTNYLVADAPTALAQHDTQSLLLRESGDFNGARIVAPISPTDLDYNWHEWTAACWFKRSTSTNDDFIFYLGNSDGFGSPDEFQLYCPSGSSSLGLKHYIANVSTDLDLSVANIRTGEWRHAAITFQPTNGNAGIIKLYVDGTLAGTDPSVTLNMTAGMMTVFGGHGSATFAVTRWFNGRLDDMAVFDTALPAADIASLAQRPAAYLGGIRATNTVWINIPPTNRAPTLAATTNRSLIAGANLAVPSAAADPDTPPQRLFFSLLTAPAGATINLTNGLVSWRPTIAQAGTDYLFTVVVAEGGRLTNLTAAADAFVRDGTYAGTNFGTETNLAVKLGLVAGVTRESFLRFDLTTLAGGIATANLQLFPFDASSPGTHAVAFVTNDVWAETALNWSNKPASAPLVATWTPQAGVAVLAPVTAPAQAALASDRQLSLRVFATNTTSDGLVNYGSREAAASARPQLIVVTTNGPLLSATQSFRVTVITPAQPVLSEPRFTEGQFQLRVSGDAGPDYTLLGSTNLLDWAELFTTNSPALPFDWLDSDTNALPLRFYRVRLGP